MLPAWSEGRRPGAHGRILLAGLCGLALVACASPTPSLVQRGRALTDEARYEEAQTVLEAAVVQAEASPGPSLERAAAFFELGNLYVQYPPIAERGHAAELLGRAAAEYESLLGPEHPAVGIALSVEGDALLDDGDARRAAVVEQRALEIFRRTLPANHPLRLGQELGQPVLFHPDELGPLVPLAPQKAKVADFGRSTRP